jgi:hypothetical protein
VIRPWRSAAPDYYCRLFRHNLREVSEETIENLTHLAFSMLKGDDFSPIPRRHWKIDPPLAGYTYFGQFIDHNLTEDDTAIRDAGKREPWETVNYRGPWLNLSGIYNPSYDQGRWKELYQSDGVSFRLGKPTQGKSEPFDLPLNREDYPVIADERNNENVIVRQIHVMFLKLHNLAIKQLRRDHPNLPDRQLFAQARDLVCWQYQYLVRHDFLAKVCDPGIFEELVTNNAASSIDWTGGFSIPVEFAQAVLRFGHSMVRPDYGLNASGRVPLEDLLCGGKQGALKPEEAVHWPTLLTGKETAMRFDTGIASVLFGLQSKDIHSYVDTPMPHFPHALPVRTLIRGAKSRLPTGQDVATRMDVPIVQPVMECGEVGEPIYDPGKYLRTLGLIDETPLWYYILLEAEVNQRGKCLGEVGSRLLIETVNGALWKDPDSYIRRFGPDWTPEPWKVTTLLELAGLLGLF